MPVPTILIAQSDPRIAQGLANDLHAHFAHVLVAPSVMELRTLLLQHEAHAAVLDLEVVSLQEVRDLAASFEDLAIVCTHHSPDERMWTEALNAGAVDCCHPRDLHAILRAARTPAPRSTPMAA